MTEVKAAISNHLSESEERFRLVLEASPDGFIILRSLRDAAGEIADFQIEYTNPVAARRVNRTPEELVGEYLLHLFPDCQTKGIFQHYVKVAETGISETFETFYDSQQVTGWFRNVVVKVNDGIAISFSDITDRKQAELALQQQEQHFRVALQTAKLGSWEHDLTTGVLTCSAQCKANFGLPPNAEFTHETLFAALHPDDRPLVQSAIERSIAERIDYEVEERCYHPDGSLHWLIVRGQLVYDSQGTPIRMVGVTLDITEQKQFAQSLQAANQRISNILESITDAFVAFDCNWRYTYVNQEAGRMLGRSPQELLGQRLQDVFPAAVQQNSVIVQQFERAMAEQTTVRFEAFSLLINCWVDVSLFPSPEGLAMYFRDISEQQAALRERLRAEEELRQREAELRLITNAVPVLISFVDAQQRYRFNNQKYEEWFGNLATQVHGKHLWEVLGEAAYATIRPYVEQVLAGQEVSFESKISFKDGNTRFVNAAYIPRFDRQGNVEGFVALMSDITQRKQAEEIIRQSEERLRIAQQAANAGVWDWDIAANQVTWSEEYYRLYGLERATTQPSYENWLLSIVEQDRDRVDQAARNALVHRTDVNVEFRILHPHRGERWLTAIGQTFYDDNGQPKRMTGIALDITERKTAEAALRQSEAFNREILESSGDCIKVLDLDGSLLYMNTGGKTLLCIEDITPFISSSWVKFWQEADQPAAQETLNKARTVGVGTFQGYCPTLAGEPKWWDVKMTPIKGADGQAERLLCISRDITDYKQAEAALRESEERLRLALTAANQGLYDLNVQTGDAIVSPEYAQMLGYDPDKFQETNAKWRDRLHPDDVAVVYQSYEDYISGKLDTYRVEFRQRTKSGDWKWILSVGRTVSWDSNGQPLRMLGTHTDITDRKHIEQVLRQNEEQARLAIKVGRLGTWRYNLHTDRIELDERMREIWGEPDDAQTIPLPRVMERIHPDDREPVAIAIGAALAPGSSGTYEIDYRIIGNDGAQRWVSANGQVQFEGEGDFRRPIDFLGTALDITDRKQAEQEREQLLERERAAREQAETANRIKDEFLAVLSHELRSPLNPILGWAKLLQTRPFDQSSAKRALETIERNAKLQTQLIDDLLDISRILRGKMVLNICPVNFLVVIDAALETVRLSAEAKNIKIQKIVAGDIGLISGDYGRLQQILWNLLSNAVKFTPNGGEIEIRLEQVGTDAQIQVKDTGIGITPEFLPHVFEYFRQENSTTTRKFGGLGLGLAIVRYFTELHGGTVKAESPGEGLGAMFTVSLPLLKHQNREKTDVDVSASAVADASPLANLRILVVDDEADMRELIFTILQQTGAEVRVAASAVEALEAWDVFRPDVLISDIGMPEMDGYELMRQVRSLSPENTGKIPALALTAYAGEINQQQALAAGFHRHIAKPVEPEELVEAIVTLVK